MWSAWLKRLNAYLLARKMAEQKAQERLSDVEERARKEQEEMVLHFAEQGEPGMDLAEWKRYDNEQLARYERIRQADLAFDAEVGEPDADQRSEEGGHDMPPSIPFPPDWPQLPAALERGTRIDTPAASSRWGFGFAQWGMTTTATLTTSSSAVLTEVQTPTIGPQGVEPSTSLRWTARLGPGEISLETPPNQWGGRNYRVEARWFHRRMDIEGQRVETFRSIGLEWEALGPGYVWNKAVRLDGQQGYSAEGGLPGLPASEVQSGWYFKWMPARLAVAVAVVVVVVVVAVVVLKEIAISSPLWLPGLLGGG